MNKAQEFDRIATEIFAPLYPAVAGQIIERCGITKGTCLDIGSGGGMLGFSMLEQAEDMKMIFADINPDAIEIAINRAEERGVSHCVKGIVCAAEDIPVDNASVDLIISRGSVWFWDDYEKGFAELLRILSTGGKIYIGGGFGTKEIFEQVDAEMSKENPAWKEKVSQKFKQKLTPAVMAESFEKLGCTCTIIDDDSGHWVIAERG
ncbi:class I SAM-dependent methyltransferase [Geovibrio thiophilus]|uniref:Class I SAM-dependent methyltransferase n=1 Tax=Geovibrio thiophilus TaxID=139438 RepID=A0A410K0D3_9BACT|nr:class I SAM-dependent methyltransferase [Geovibrio thiophilus]QAR33833.1 class I SAM-dependent methyltransferase [Geovibrio thiophilus]